MLTQTAAGRTYDFSHAIGRYIGGTGGPAGDGFVQPVKIAIGGGDTIYALNRGAESTDTTGDWLAPRAYGVRIGKFNIGTAPGDEEFVTEFSGFGYDDGDLVWPAGIALDSQENVYVSDEWLNRVSVFDEDGAYLRCWGSFGDGPGQFNRPSGLAIDEADGVYVVDSLNHRVQRLTTDGAFVAGWGEVGGAAGQLDSPWGIALDSEGNVYVADHGNHRVQKFTTDGRFLLQFGSHGSGRGELDHPSDVTVDPDGDVYVCDWANNRVQIFGPEGDFIMSLVGDAQELSKWAKEDVEGDESLQKARRRVDSLEPEWRLALPMGVTFDPNKRRLIVADTQRHRVQIYDKPPSYVEAQFNL